MPPDTPVPVVRPTPEDVARLRDDRRSRTSMEIDAIIHVVQPLSADLLATLCFYLTYAATGSVGVATVLAAALGLGQLAWAIAHRQPVPPIQWASLLLVCLVGGVSLLTGDPRYVLYKAAVIYVVIGCTMLRRGWLVRYVPPIALTYMPRTTVIAFGYMWAALLLGHRTAEPRADLDGSPAHGRARHGGLGAGLQAAPPCVPVCGRPRLRQAQNRRRANRRRHP